MGLQNNRKLIEALQTSAGGESRLEIHTLRPDAYSDPPIAPVVSVQPVQPHGALVIPVIRSHAGHELEATLGVHEIQGFLQTHRP